MAQTKSAQSISAAIGFAAYSLLLVPELKVSTFQYQNSKVSKHLMIIRPYLPEPRPKRMGSLSLGQSIVHI